MDRRRFLLTSLAGALAGPLAAGAQQPGKAWRIGYLGVSSLSLEWHLVEAFQRGLRDRGYVEGQNIVIEYRWAEGRDDRFPPLVRELVSLKVDLIVTAGTPATLAAKQATTTIPIVMAVTGDALEVGLVSSLARPGGNVSGLSMLMPELEGKRFELLKEVLPRLAHVAVLTNPGNPFTAISWRTMRIAAETLGARLQTFEIRAPEDFEHAFTAIKNAQADALTLIGDRFLLAHRKRIVDFAIRGRFAGIYPYSEFVVEGGLMSYGPNYPAMFRHSAVYVDKILKGAKPADLPIEQPTQFELVISHKTAKTLGLTIPPSLLARADQVIE
jgi:putative tryptophan/tyrosine transport system substrate-binding protein